MLPRWLRMRSTRRSTKGLCTVPGNDPNNPGRCERKLCAPMPRPRQTLCSPRTTRRALPADGDISNVSCNGTGVQVTYSALGHLRLALRSPGWAARERSPLLEQPRPPTAWEAASARCAYSATSVRTTLTSLSRVVTSTSTATSRPDRTATGPQPTRSRSRARSTDCRRHMPRLTGRRVRTSPDPFAGVTLPSSPWTGLTSKDRSLHAGTQESTAAFNIKNTTCVLQQGAYVFTGRSDVPKHWLASDQQRSSR